MNHDAAMNPFFLDQVTACESSGRLTDWEADFVADLRTRLESGGVLSGRQAEILSRVHRERVAAPPRRTAKRAD